LALRSAEMRKCVDEFVKESRQKSSHAVCSDFLALPNKGGSNTRFAGGGEYSALGFFHCSGVKLDPKIVSHGVFKNSSVFKTINNLENFWHPNFNVKEIRVVNSGAHQVAFDPSQDGYILTISSSEIDSKAVFNNWKSVLNETKPENSILRRIHESNEISLEGYWLGVREFKILKQLHVAGLLAYAKNEQVNTQIKRVDLKSTLFGPTHVDRSDPTNLSLIVGDSNEDINSMGPIIKWLSGYNTLERDIVYLTSSHVGFQGDLLSNHHLRELWRLIPTIIQNKDQIGTIILDKNGYGSFDFSAAGAYKFDIRITNDKKVRGLSKLARNFRTIKKLRDKGILVYTSVDSKHDIPLATINKWSKNYRSIDVEHLVKLTELYPVLAERAELFPRVRLINPGDQKSPDYLSGEEYDKNGTLTVNISRNTLWQRLGELNPRRLMAPSLAAPLQIRFTIIDIKNAIDEYKAAEINLKITIVVPRQINVLKAMMSPILRTSLPIVEVNLDGRGYVGYDNEASSFYVHLPDSMAGVSKMVKLMVPLYQRTLQFFLERKVTIPLGSQIGVAEFENLKTIGNQWSDRLPIKVIQVTAHDMSIQRSSDESDGSIFLIVSLEAGTISGNYTELIQEFYTEE